MNPVPAWWQKPRRISVVVDNPSWIVPFAQAFVAALNDAGDHPRLCRSYAEVQEGGVAFFLGCTGIAAPAVLTRNLRNLVVHESALPQGRGFSPLTWQILEGRNEIPICLIEAGAEVDAGAVIYREVLCFRGDELIEELRAEQGRMTVELCQRFLAEAQPPQGVVQTGAASSYRRRQPCDSRIDPQRTLAEQFELLRVVDNARYPAFFDFRGRRYRLKIEAASDDQGEAS
jgi:methionyl-tRNA formyltransferase